MLTSSTWAQSINVAAECLFSSSSSSSLLLSFTNDLVVFFFYLLIYLKIFTSSVMKLLTSIHICKFRDVSIARNVNKCSIHWITYFSVSWWHKINLVFFPFPEKRWSAADDIEENCVLQTFAQCVEILRRWICQTQTDKKKRNQNLS